MMARKLLLGLLLLAILLGFSSWAVLALRGVVLRNKTGILSTLDSVFRDLNEGKDKFQNLDFVGAEDSFTKAHGALQNLEGGLGILFQGSIRLARLLPSHSFLRQALESVGTLDSLATEGAKSSRAALQIERDMPTALFNQSAPLMADIDQERNSVQAITALLENVNASYGSSWALQSLGKFELATTLNHLHDAEQELDAFRWLLGPEGTRTYVLLFQNPAELRPTGGFVSSFAVVKLSQGHLIDFHFYNMAEADSELKVRVIPPRPLRKIARSWVPSDANWFLDFPTSAQKEDFFLKNSINVTSDGIITINPSVIAGLLRLTGPVTIPGYNLTLDTNTFWKETQIQVRLDQAGGHPKRFLRMFGEELLGKLKNLTSQDVPPVEHVLADALASQELQLYFRDPAMEAIALEKGWGGKLSSNANEDFLAVVDTNIGGEKSDFLMYQNLALLTKIGADGTIINTLKITRIHQGLHAPFLWWRAKNYDYLRVYVPLGAELLGAQGGNREPPFHQINYDAAGYLVDSDVGILNGKAPVVIGNGASVETFEETGKTVFATWLNTDPGQINTFTIVYRLPWNTGFISPSYHLLIQRQPGIVSDLSHTLSLPDGTTLIGGDLTTSGTLDRNVGQSILFQFPNPVEQ